ncbi:MAG: hypothetical protein WAU32_04355 [Thermoanaerobaculia bacterium]
MAPLAVLTLENLAIFFRHYFRGYGFPWDFVGSYYAASAYWTSAIARGALSLWMPYQSMGYPFPINLQTGLWYAPLWVFPLLKIPYTLHAAVVLQGLHVLLGAAGMYVLLRLVLGSRREALIGAFAFQLFGGFYSNAEHVDIVRSFAFLPWLLACLVPPRPGEPAVPRRLLALPLFVWAMATGGYPGNLVAALFSLGVLVCLQVAARRFSKPALAWAAGAGAAVALGLAMAAIHLGPAWISRSELERYHVTGGLQRASLGLEHLPGLVMETRGMSGDISMSSTFIGFLVVAGICFLTRRTLATLWPYAALLVLSAAMAAGNSSPIHPILRSLIPPLAYSRFPSSDYRCFTGALLILLSAAGWRELRHRPRRAGVVLLRLAPVAVFAAWAILRVERGLPFWPSPAQALLCFGLAAAGLLLWQSRRVPALAATLVLLAVVSLDAARVLSRMETWAVPDLMGMSRLYYPTPARMHDAGVVVDPRVFAQEKPPRPPRIEGDAGYRASGYLSGSYNLGDFGGPILRAREAIAKNPAFLDFMRREWLPVVVDAPGETAGGPLEVPNLETRLSAAAPDSRVEQRSYGTDRIDYRIRLETPALLVENETYFPGWTARLYPAPEARAVIPAVRVNGIWRGWLLPAGDYAMEARFRFRALRILAALTLLAWLVWLALCAAGFRATLSRLFPPVRV